MSVWGVLPARFGSTRFPGKPLVKIQGLELIAWVIRGAKTSRLLDKVIVATDDQRIAAVAQREGAEVAMTASDIPSGTDRVWAAIKDKSVEIVLNIQGDEPLVTGGLIDSLIQPMLKDQMLEMATLAHPISTTELMSEHSVKVVVNHRSEALYFSRYAIPYSRKSGGDHPTGALKHIGMYAFRGDFLKRYCQVAPVEIEMAESLEQLRALHMGARIKVVTTEQRSWGVDTPEDIAVIENLLAQKSSEKNRGENG